MDEIGLDPQDWEAFRALAHRAVDDVVDTLRDVRDTPVWRPIPEDVKERFHRPLPIEGTDADEVYDEVRDYMLPYRLGTIHPRFWTRVAGAGTPMGALADFLSAAMNNNVAGQESCATVTETQVIDWLKEILSFPAEATGVLTVGASAGNLIGLGVARFVHGCGVVYCSDEAHHSIDKGAHILGLEPVRHIACDEQFRIRLDLLEAAIEEDLANGRKPIAVVGSVGTVGTGSIDDLDGLADLAQRYGVWFHIDGAFGALAALSPDLKPLLKGLERSDSIGFDMHKWMSLPYDVGCGLVRDAEAHRLAFAHDAVYLAKTIRGPSAGKALFYELGPDLSRSFRALKVWMCLKTYGTEHYGRVIRQNVDQARYLACRIESESSLRLMMEPPLNIVLFRYEDEALDDGALDRLNEEIMLRIIDSGFAIYQTLVVRGKKWMRVVLTNHRTRRQDLDRFVEEVLKAGRELGSAGS